MALTPEDVVNKRFQATKFREGYDQDEVDDFLDEVVVELRRLNQENEELRQRVAAAEARASRGCVGTRRRGPAAGTRRGLHASRRRRAHRRRADAGRPVRSPSSTSRRTTNLLQLARRLHEEHVARASRSATRSSPRATRPPRASSPRPRPSSAPQIGHPRPGARRRSRSASTSSASFERDYRQKLKSYIEGQLRELDTAAPVSGLGQPGLPSPVSAEQPAPTFQGFGG